MSRRIVTVFVATAAMVLMAPLGSPAAGDGVDRAPFTVTGFVIAGGGGSSSDGSVYEMTGAIGQPVISASYDGVWVVTGGIWNAQSNTISVIFADGFEDGDLVAWGAKQNNLNLDRGGWQ